MKPTDALYFVALLTAAWDQGGSNGVFQEAFARIEAMGAQPAYHRGYSQFLAFMHEALGYSDLAPESLGDGQEPSALLLPAPMLQCMPECARRIIQAHQDTPDTIRLILEKDEVQVLDTALSCQGGTVASCDATPGKYRLSAGTGWVLWEDQLAGKDLVLGASGTLEPLRLAADSGTVQERPPTRDIVLLDGELSIRVYAGIESGRLLIETHRLPKEA